jgi:hypothetical protein
VRVAELSPELVLVSPDLREGARIALPERPWETLLPRGSAVQDPPPETAARSAVARTVAAVPGLIVLGFASLCIVGSLPWLGEHPTLERPERATVSAPGAAGTKARDTPGRALSAAVSRPAPGRVSSASPPG